MPEFNKDELRGIKSFDQLIKYLRDELDWPIEADDFEDSTFDYEPEELGIDPETAAKIQEIKQLRPLTSNQPWGIFFVKFEPKKLPVVVLRRILSKLVIKKRTSAVKSEQAVWNLHDLLFISNYGEGDHRQITFANFSQDENNADLPTLKVLGWDYEDTELHLDNVHHELKAKLRWPADEKNIQKWRETWSSAFILRNQEVITTSKDLAIRLAALAQRIRGRAKRVLELENANGAMRQLYRAFQETLIHDLKEDDFADMYAQTIAYGLLAARMSRPMGITSSNITDMVPNTNPFLRDILATFITTGGRHGKIDFDELGVQEIVELLNSPETHMEAILRDFGNRTRQEDPVIHFYELFLTEYDKKKKVERGVFYTPQPVVSYIVRSVHELLQKEFGLEDGLADITTWGEITKRNKEIKIPEGVSPNEPFVQILDPAVGTATFLVEVIDVIHKTMMTKWLKMGYMALEFPQLWNEYVPTHLLPRVYGYELMMAPYAIAHMRLGLKLFETGYRFGSNTPRANIYLTNSLEPAGEVGPHRKFELLAPALAHEASAVNNIKWNKNFTIVIGNPPYSGDSLNPSFDAQGKPTFIGNLIERYKNVDGVHTLDKNLKGLQDDYVKFISLAQWLIANSGVGIIGYITNHAYLDATTFPGVRKSLIDSFTIIRVFDLHGNVRKKEKAPDNSEDVNVFDIQQGVAILLAQKWPCQQNSKRLEWSEVWGTRNHKYCALDANTYFTTSNCLLDAKTPFYLFVSQDGETEQEWNHLLKITSLFSLKNTGIETGRDDFIVCWTPEETWERIRAFINLSPNLAREKFNLGNDSQGWQVETAQKDVAGSGPSKKNIVMLNYRPFDIRYTYYTGKVRGIHRRPRRELMQHLHDLKTNLALIIGRSGGVIGDNEWNIVSVTRNITDYNYFRRGGSMLLPLYLAKGPIEAERLIPVNEINLNDLLFTNYFKKSDLNEQLFSYIYAILHCPTYRARYAQFLKIDFPRLPIPHNIQLFQSLAALGDELISYHLLESVKGNKFITTWEGSKPSKQIDKITYSDNTVWINKTQSEGFHGVPENVWDFHIGGYQVCDKWLKDRKGRVLSTEDINHYQKIVVALNETIRIMKEIDEFIDQHGGWPRAFQ